MTRRIAFASAIFAIAACAQRPAATNTNTAPQPQVGMAADTGMRGMRDGDRRGMRGMGGERMDAMMFEGITLTDAQKAQIDSIHARHRGEMQGLDPRNNPGDREKMRQMMQTHMAEIRAVLTPDQQAVFDKNVAQMRERRGSRDGGAPPRE